MMTRRSTTATITFIVIVLLIVALLCAVGTADAAASSSRRSKTPSERKREVLRREKEKEEQEQKLNDQYYEDRYKEYQKALPSADSMTQLVPEGHKDKEEMQFIRKMTVGKLRRFLKDREANCAGCVEKHHLIERAMQVRGWDTENDRITRDLTPAQFSAENALAFQHLQAGIPVDAQGNPMVQTTQSKEQLTAIQLSHGIHCSEALANGTQYCHHENTATM